MKIHSRRLAAFSSMLLGSAGVFGLLYFMNELSDPQRAETKKVTRDFRVDKQERKQKQEVHKPKPKPRKVTHTARTAPMPNISTALSGLSFDLPQFETGDLADTEELLKGSNADKKLVMTEDAVDELPQPRSRTAPEYPARARQRGIEGHVTLELEVSERGDVEQVRVIDAEPVGVFEDVAIAAVQRWTFEPAHYKGEPVAISVSQRIPFRLD